MVSTCAADKRHYTPHMNHGHARGRWMVLEFNSITFWPMGTLLCSKCGMIILFQLVLIIVVYIAFSSGLANVRLQSIGGINFKNWAPKLDENGTATSFCNCVMEQLTRIQEVSCQSLEKCLVQAGKLHGTYGSKKLVFRPAEDLLRLRRRRRTASDLVERKQLSFQIRKLHRQESRTWRSASLRLCLNNSSSWNLMRGMLQPTGSHVVEQPHPNDFVNLLENIFSGNLGRPMDRPMLTEAPWSMNELRVAIERAKNNRTGDDLGLVAELLKHVPEGYLEALLDVFRHALSTGQIPTSWQTTIFKMFPKSSCAKFASDFRPIASLRLLYKIFAYLMLGRMEDTLDDSQPEEQHGFRKQRRIEEHLLTANLCLQKTMEANIPLWIISLDLSKAFDKANWEHGVSQYLVWILQCIYYGQSAKVREHFVDSRDFGIHAGVRQGCVLSPRLFCAVLEFAAKIESYGLNLHDGMKALLDLRFADDLLVFATSRDDTIRLLEELVTSLGQVGLTLNTSKTKILTTQAQPGSSLQTSGGVTVEILDSRCAHKWLGCMLQAAQGGNPSADLQHHLQAASRAFHANRSILTNHQVSVKDRLTFFHAVVTPVACFAAGHRKIFKQELAALDVAHRKLLRRMVGPPAGMDWSRPWHEILHDWNVRVSIFVGQAGFKPWSHTCLEQHWKLGH